MDIKSIQSELRITPFSLRAILEVGSAALHGFVMHLLAGLRT